MHLATPLQESDPGWESDLFTIFEGSPTMMLLLDGDLRIVRANSAAASFSGRPQSELVGASIGELMGCRNRNDSPNGCGHGPNCSVCLVRGALGKTLSTGQSQTNFGIHLDLDASKAKNQFDGQGSCTPGKVGSKVRMFLSLTEITTQSKAEMRVSSFLKLGFDLLEARTVSDAARIILVMAQQLISLDACSIALCDEGSCTLQTVQTLHRVGCLALNVEIGRLRITDCLARKVFAEGGLMVFNKPTMEIAEGTTPSGDTTPPLASILHVPIRHHSEILGLLSIESHNSNAYDGEDLNLAQSLADHYGGALERIRAQESEGEAIAVLEQAQSLVKIGSWSSYPDARSGRRQLRWSREAHRIADIPNGQLTGDPELFLARAHPEDQQKVRAAFGSGASFELDHRIVLSDGEIRWVQASAEVVCDHEGRPLRILGLLRDITEHRQTAEVLRRSERRWKDIFEYAPQACCLLNQRGTFLEVNSAAEALLGHSREALVGHGILQLGVLGPGELSRLATMLEKDTKHTRSGFEQFDLRRKDGSQVSAEVWMDTVQVEGEMHALVMARDITDRKRTEEQIRAHEEQFRTLVESGPLGIFVQVDSRFAFLNGAAARLFAARSPAELVGTPVLDRCHPSEHPKARKHILLEAGKAQKAGNVETTLVRMNSTSFAVEFTAVPFLYQKSEGSLVFFQDVTERRGMEEQLRQSMKMEAVGQLAGGVAHDFNNILAAVLLQMGIVRATSKLSGVVRKNLAELEQETMRAAGVVRQLLLFSRQEQVRMDSVDLNDVIGNLLKMLRRLIGENVDIEFRIAKGGAWVNADVGMVEQVAMNLCLNGRDAMPRGGKLILELSRVEIEETCTTPGALPGSFIRLTVIDTGCGMDSSILQHIFEPFFTTKERGKGTGLGLASVYGIVKQHDGWMDVQSEVGRGSSFHIHFPAVSASPTGPIKTIDSELITGGTEGILLVEDADWVRKPAAMCLRKMGYVVWEAVNGAQALELWSEHKNSLHLLLADFVLPGPLNGMDIARDLRTERPDLVVIIASGSALDHLRAETACWGSFHFIQKPYLAITLLRYVRLCLDRVAHKGQWSECSIPIPMPSSSTPTPDRASPHQGKCSPLLT